MRGNSTMAGQSPPSDPPDNLGDISEKKVYRICIVISLVWCAGAIAYFLYRPANFMRMWPHEFGELLAGWAAPLAALWVFATSFLQRTQLKVQRLELQHTSDELRRSVEQIERNALTVQLTHLSRRMMHAAVRCARTGEDRDIYLVKDGDREGVLHILGGHSHYSELFRANEQSRALDLLGKGLDTLTQKISEEWVLHADLTMLDELCADLDSLKKIISELQRLEGPIKALNMSDYAPDESALTAFGKRVAHTNAILDAMLHELRNFDVPDGTRPDTSSTSQPR